MKGGIEREMLTTRGKSVVNRIAIGPLQVLRREKRILPSTGGRTPAQEWTRFEMAREGACGQLTALYDKAVAEAGEHSAFILVMHREILSDTSYEEAVRGAIENQGATAEEAVAKAGEHFASLLEDVEDPYVRERAEDVQAVSQRVIRVLQGGGDLTLRRPAPSIVVAEALTPEETVQMDKSRLLGIVMSRGSLMSHTAILARRMEIPALMGLDIDESWDGRMAVLDGASGCLHIDPTPEFLARMEQRQRREQAVSRMLKEWKHTYSATMDGHGVPVFAEL